MQSAAVRSACSSAALTALVLATACSKTDKPAADTTPAVPAAAPVTDESLMAKGLEEMGAGNGKAAVSTFHEVLGRNPTHYGAHFQIAKAFDKAGMPDSARVYWTKVSTMAEAIKDTQSVKAAKARLAQPDTVSQEAMMAVGMDLMNAQNNPAGAVDQFRKVLKRNSTHYGATYQLAKALDKAGKPAEAHEVWVKVLGMATAIKDQASIDVARARLKTNP